MVDAACLDVSDQDTNKIFGVAKGETDVACQVSACPPRRIVHVCLSRTPTRHMMLHKDVSTCGAVSTGLRTPRPGIANPPGERV